jgi:DNA-binding GntR family transcriptional regulator
MAQRAERDPRADEYPAQPVKHYMLGDQIKDRLLTSIMEGEFAPGERIVETQIAREFGISQGPVREALRDLAALGLVELQPYRGARVRKPTREEHLEAMRVRTELEVLAARDATGKLSAEATDRLRRLCAEMEQASRAGSLHDHALKNTEFHATMMLAAGNRTLERVWMMLQPFAQTYLTVTVAGLSPAGDYVDLHGPILEALLSGDPDLAEGAIREHGRVNEAMVLGADDAGVYSTSADPPGWRRR